MAFLPKEELHAKANELGINIEEYSFAQLQGVVAKALAGTDAMASPNKGNSYQLDPMTNKKVVGQAHIVGRMKPKVEDFIKGKQIFSPELKLKANQFYGFDEIVGDQPRELSDPFAEMRLNIGNNTSDSNTEVIGGQVIKSKTGKKVVATTGMPHANAEIYYDPDDDAGCGLFCARFGNIDGFIWSNQSPIVIFDPDDRSKYIHIGIKGVRDVLVELDRISEWQKKCEADNRQNYAHNIKVIDKAFVRSMLREIQMDILKEKKLNGD